MEKRKKTSIWSNISQKRLFTFFGRFALIRSNDRQALAALGGLTIEVDHMNDISWIFGLNTTHVINFNGQTSLSGKCLTIITTNQSETAKKRK